MHPCLNTASKPFASISSMPRHCSYTLSIRIDNDKVTIIRYPFKSSKCQGYALIISLAAMTLLSVNIFLYAATPILSVNQSFWGDIEVPYKLVILRVKLCIDIDSNTR
uniref:Uncharacterized protein n=1 Tax=Glossina austeni TaxID=7395 RepID=A0A1A9VG51_GLOAU